MAPFVGKKPLSCRKSPRKICESETGNFTKNNILKVTIGEPKSTIQDIFTNNIPEAIIDVEDEEITFNIKKGTSILIKKRGCAKKRKRSEIGSHFSPLQKRSKTSFGGEEAIGIKVILFAKRIKISFPDEKSIDMIEDLVPKSSETSTEKLTIQTIQEFAPKPVKIRFTKKNSMEMIKDLVQERSKISFLHKEKPMEPIKTIEDFAKKRGKISFPDEKQSIDKMEDLNKVKHGNEPTMTKVEQKSFKNDSKVEQKPFKSDDSLIPEEITMDESNNSLRLFLSDDEQTED
jgi:hypothetical protein